MKYQNIDEEQRIEKDCDMDNGVEGVRRSGEHCLRPDGGKIEDKAVNTKKGINHEC